MPITSSAKKALRQSGRRRVGNLARGKALKEAIKDFKGAPSRDALSAAYQHIDKAVKASILKPNKGARLKSQLAKTLSAAK